MASAWRNAMAAVGVLIGLGALVAVPAVVDAALPDDGSLPAGDRLEVGYGVALRPPPGARLDLGVSRPGTGEVALLVGGHRLAVTAVEVRERPADFVSHTLEKFGREALRPGPPTEAWTTAGVRGQRADLRVEDDFPGVRPGCAAIFTGPVEIADSAAGSDPAGGWTALAAEGTVAGAVLVISPVSGCVAVPAELWASVTSVTFEPVDRW